MPAQAQRCARAVVAYDGTAFAGSQYQPTVRTVQGELERALNRLTGERVRVRLAGRTDAGVHATGQVAAFCLPGHDARGWGWSELRRRLNAVLPDDVAVRSLQATPGDFDPRRDADLRIYRYRIRMNGARDPLDRHRTLEIDDRLDVTAMNATATALVGERDFGALGRDDHGNTVRRIVEVTIRRSGNLVEVRVVATAFLRRMVRSIVALMLEVGRGRMAPAQVPDLLGAGARVLHGRAAPARGLTLERVIYLNSAVGRRGRRLQPENRRVGT